MTKKIRASRKNSKTYAKLAELLETPGSMAMIEQEVKGKKRVTHRKYNISISNTDPKELPHLVYTLSMYNGDITFTRCTDYKTDRELNDLFMKITLSPDDELVFIRVR